MLSSSRNVSILSRYLLVRKLSVLSQCLHSYVLIWPILIRTRVWFRLSLFEQSRVAAIEAKLNTKRSVHERQTYFYLHVYLT